MIELETRWTKNKKMAAERMEICESCEHFNKTLVQCNECGCFLKAKTIWPNSKCPLNKWGRYKENENG
jgi:hypothetical protein